MRITFITPCADRAGGFRVLADYAQALKNRGHEVVVVSLPPPELSLRNRARMLIKERRLPVNRLWASHFDQTDVRRIVLDRERKVVASDVPDSDVVIATWWETAEWVAELPASKGAKAYFIQGHEIWAGNAERVHATYRLPMQKITISRWLADVISQESGQRPECTILCPNGVNLSQFHAPMRQKHQLPTIGLAYSTHPVKGLDVSLKAIERVMKQLPEARVVSFGHRDPVAEFPLPRGSAFTASPPQDRIADIYAAADVWICGSRSEGFCLPMLESMACRTPVVATRVGGPVDVMEDGVSGYIVDIGDDAAIADRVLRVLRMTPEEWKGMSDAAHATAQRFGVERAAELFEAALVQTVGRERFAA